MTHPEMLVSLLADALGGACAGAGADAGGALHHPAAAQAGQASGPSIASQMLQLLQGAGAGPQPLPHPPVAALPLGPAGMGVAPSQLAALARLGLFGPQQLSALAAAAAGTQQQQQQQQQLSECLPPPLLPMSVGAFPGLPPLAYQVSHAGGADVAALQAMQLRVLLAQAHHQQQQQQQQEQQLPQQQQQQQQLGADSGLAALAAAAMAAGLEPVAASGAACSSGTVSARVAPGGVAF